MQEKFTINGIQVGAIAGGKEYLRVPAMWLESTRHMPLTRGGLTLLDPDGSELKRLKAGDSAALFMGYRGQEPDFWEAEILWVKEAGDKKIELGLVGTDKILSRHRITEAWMHETPEAILRQALAQAGINVARLDAPGCVLPRFCVSNDTLWQIVEKLELTCQRSFGIDLSAVALWLDKEGNANWGDFEDPKQDLIPATTTGENLIAHTPATDAGSLSFVETFLLPGMRHSQQFLLQDLDRGQVELLRIQKVRHESESGAVRTKIWYGPERSRY